MRLQRVFKKSLLRVSASRQFIYLDGFAAGQTDVEAYEPSGAFQRVAMPYAGRIVRATVQSSSARTAGTLNVYPTVNGTKLVATGLNLTLDGSHTTKHYCSVSATTTSYAFAAGDTLGAMLASDGAWANGSGDLQITYYVVFDHQAEG